MQDGPGCWHFGRPRAVSLHEQRRSDRAEDTVRHMYTAIECPSFGPIDGLRLVERESPALRPGTVRIAVTACGVNFVDGSARRGPLPDQAAGAVRAGDGGGRPGERARPTCVARRCPLQVGDRVFANVGFGGFASEAVVSAAQVSPVAPNAERRPGRHVHAELHDRVVRARDGPGPGAAGTVDRWCSVQAAASGSRRSTSRRPSACA